ncbi:unnamed protein product [Ectocarpus sp. 12 AP-2014]
MRQCALGLHTRLEKENTSTHTHTTHASTHEKTTRQQVVTFRYLETQPTNPPEGDSRAEPDKKNANPSDGWAAGPSTITRKTQGERGLSPLRSSRNANAHFFFWGTFFVKAGSGAGLRFKKEIKKRKRLRGRLFFPPPTQHYNRTRSRDTTSRERKSCHAVCHKQQTNRKNETKNK